MPDVWILVDLEAKGGGQVTIPKRVRDEAVMVLRCAADLVVTGFRSYGSSAIQSIVDKHDDVGHVALTTYDVALTHYIGDGNLTEVSPPALLAAAALLECDNWSPGDPVRRLP